MGVLTIEEFLVLRKLKAIYIKYFKSGKITSCNQGLQKEIEEEIEGIKKQYPDVDIEELSDYNLDDSDEDSNIIAES